MPVPALLAPIWAPPRVVSAQKRRSRGDAWIPITNRDGVVVSLVAIPCLAAPTPVLDLVTKASAGHVKSKWRPGATVETSRRRSSATSSGRTKKASAGPENLTVVGLASAPWIVESINARSHAILDRRLSILTALAHPTRSRIALAAELLCLKLPSSHVWLARTQSPVANNPVGDPYRVDTVVNESAMKDLAPLA